MYTSVYVCVYVTAGEYYVAILVLVNPVTKRQYNKL